MRALKVKEDFKATGGHTTTVLATADESRKQRAGASTQWTRS